MRRSSLSSFLLLRSAILFIGVSHSRDMDLYGYDLGSVVVANQQLSVTDSMLLRLMPTFPSVAAYSRRLPGDSPAASDS